jgi:integrase
MARTIRDAKLETRAARDRLAPGRTPHFKTLVPGKLHLGYRRKRKDVPGQWLVRHYLGQERYHVAPLGLADDFEDASDNNELLTFADAQRAAHDHRVARRAGRGMSVAGAIAEYVGWLRVERPRVAANTLRTAELLILPRLGRIKLADLTAQQITDWRDALASEPARVRTQSGEPQKFKAVPTTKDAQRARRATTNRVLALLKAALNRAFKDGQAQDDLAWRRVEPFAKTHAARPGYLTVAECKRLINAADRDSGFRNLVQAALLTGCRYGELRALDVRDFHRRKLHIRDSKSGKPRDVVLSDEGAAFFARITAGRPGNAALLPRKDRRWQPSEQFLPMRDACARARIAPPIGIHQLRHTWASLAVMNGMPLMVVARNLGHTSTLMCERHYAHLRDDYMDKAVRDAAPTYGFKADKKKSSQCTEAARPNLLILH